MHESSDSYYVDFLLQNKLLISISRQNSSKMKNTVLVTFVSLWPNTWRKQLKKREGLFCSWLQTDMCIATQPCARGQNILAAEVCVGTAHIMGYKKQKRNKGARATYSLWGQASWGILPPPWAWVLPSSPQNNTTISWVHQGIKPPIPSKPFWSNVIWKGHPRDMLHSSGPYSVKLAAGIAYHK